MLCVDLVRFSLFALSSFLETVLKYSLTALLTAAIVNDFNLNSLKVVLKQPTVLCRYCPFCKLI